MKAWQCVVCNYIHKGNTPPEKCPVCNVPATKFKEIDEVSITGKIAKPRQPKEKNVTSKTIDVTNFEKIKSILIKYHAHPVSVHTPNGLLPVAMILWLLAWVFDSQLFAKTAFINQIFVILSLPFVIFTGFLEWQNKYHSALTTTFKLKIFAAIVMTITCSISSLLFLIDPGILLSSKAWGFIFINAIMLVAAGIAGHIGGKLVFKE